jgi:glycosyltransferase involved in cell wall biosynthesis
LGDLQSLPNTELLWYLRALSQTGNYDLAKESFLEVFANRKFHENLYSNMARLAQVTGDFEFHKKMCIELLRTPDVSVVIRGINEFARSSVDDEELLQWSIEIFPHMSSEEKDFFLNELIENSRFKTILGFEEIRTSPKLSQYAILSSLRENSSTKIINEFLTNPLEFNISDRTFVPIFNHYYENEQYSIAESLVMNSHSWGISKKFTRATMHSLIFAMARELDLAKIQKLLSNFSILNIKIPRKVFERATTFFINSGGDAESFFSHVEDPMKNLVGGHSALFEMLSKCGFVDKADEIFTLALLRFLTDPINEDEFPDSVMSTGRREYVYELFYRLVDFPNVASENVDFIKKCEDLHFLAPGIFSNFSSEKFMDRNLIDSYIISNIIDECNYSPYDTVHSRKVIHVSNSIKKGGAERQVINCLGLANSDSSLAVWNISRNDEYNSYISDFQSLNLPIYDYSEDKTETSSFPPVIDALLRCLPVAPGLNPGFTKQVRNLTHLFQTEKPNVVHLWQDATNIAGGIAALIAGVPKIVMSARSSPPFPIPNTSIPEKGSVYFIHSRFTRGAYRKLLENPNVLLCHNSNIGAQLYCEWLEFPSNRSSEFHIIRNGFSFEINTTGETREKNFNHVGGIFRLKEVKRPMLWIKSAELMIRNGFKYNFTIVGDGPMMQKCKDYIVSKGLSERIKLVGFSDDVGSWLEKFDILLHTSAIEGLPNVLIEAQSYGVPVVATDAGGSRETFIDNVTGILCNDDSESISQTVSMALSNTDWISNARKQSAIWALDSFSISQMQATLLQMYGWSK